MITSIPLYCLFIFYESTSRPSPKRRPAIQTVINFRPKVHTYFRCLNFHRATAVAGIYQNTLWSRKSLFRRTDAPYGIRVSAQGHRMIVSIYRIEGPNAPWQQQKIWARYLRYIALFKDHYSKLRYSKQYRVQSMDTR